MRRSYKTVRGYLRSCEEKILMKMPTGRDREEEIKLCIAAAHSGMRQAVNQLLPQMGISDQINNNEKPSEGVSRLLGRDGLTERQTAALQDCQKWIKNFLIPISIQTKATRVESGA